MSRHTRLVRSWAHETGPLHIIGNNEPPAPVRALPEYRTPDPIEKELEAARRSIEEMRARAEAEIEARREQVRQEALAQARAELQSEFEALVDASFQRFNMVVNAARAEQEKIARAAERDLIELAIAIAADIVGEAPPEEMVERRVRRGLSLLAASEVLTILVHPDDVALVTPWIERWRQAEGVQAEIIPDRAIEPGGCEIVSRSGIYDLGPQARLEMIAEALRAEVDAA
ncbi:MAG TPA: FliH/SctL family protein [Thermomicrobiales bacterium]|nr:FliH/SctL family protein [Thermomicrobiales bacterium]